MIIEVKGVGFINKGAELMLRAILEKLKVGAPQAKIVMEVNASSPYFDRGLLGIYQKPKLRIMGFDFSLLAIFIPKIVRRYLTERYGLIFPVDVDVILDASGFAYGDQWPLGNARLAAREAKRLSKRGGNYIFLPQAFGPFTRKAEKAAITKALQNATAIFARDDESLLHVREIIRGDVVQHYPDFTNAVSAQKVDVTESGQPFGVVIPNFKMLTKMGRRKYLDILLAACKSMHELGLKVVLLNHQGTKDASLCKELIGIFDAECLYIQEPDPIRVKGIIGASAVVVCSRFHGCVSALSQGVPCIGTSWSHKYETLFKDYGRAPFVIRGDIGEQEMKALIEDVMSPLSAEHLRKIEFYKVRTSEMWRNVFSVLGTVNK